MRILRNYILLECVAPFLTALSALTCVFLLGYLVKLANLVINKGVSLLMVGKVFALYVPVLLTYTLPLACLIGVILTFSRMSADNEIMAIRASGVLLRRLLTPLIAAGIVLSLITFILNDRVIPYAYHEQRATLKNIGVSNPTALLEPGIFITAFEGQVLFIHKVEDNRLYNITIYQPQPDGKPTRTIIAREGEFTSVPGEDKVILKLLNGTSDEVDINDPGKFYKLNFNTLFITLDLSQNREKVDKKPREMSLKELTAEIDRLEALLVDVSRLKTEYHRKISWSLTPLIFILMAFPLAVITNKREKSANVLIAGLCAAAYYLLVLGSEALSIEKIAPAYLVMWTPPVIGLSVAAYLNYRMIKK